MKIQFISKEKINNLKTNYTYTSSTLNEPQTFDDFDINIISLQNTALWKNKKDSKLEIDELNDFKSLNIMISNSKKSSTIILFPQNYPFYYHKHSSGYFNQTQLKDMLNGTQTILSYLLPEYINYDLIYENSNTVCCDETFTAAFYFEEIYDYKVLTTNNGAHHPTTIKVDKKLIYSTLDFSNENKSIDKFIKAIGLEDKKINTPDWIKDIIFYDDEKQNEIVRSTNEEISQLYQKINEAESQLEKNLYYKSILFENGDNLVKPVSEILENFTEVSLADFVDEKKEDFKLCLSDVTFIGEIKGITSNVKNEHISQLDVHCQTYADFLEETSKVEKIKGILIINPLRNKPLTEREEVHENQIKLAQRNESLIITTETLLEMFSFFLKNDITREEIINLLKTKIGILQPCDFIK